jgi:hypothetical protein
MKKLILALALSVGLSNLALAGGKGDQGQGGKDPLPPPAPPRFEQPRNGGSAKAWSCQLKGQIKGVKIGFIWGAQYLGGRGVLGCADRAGRQAQIPVKLRLLGAGWAFDLTYVRKAKLISTGIGYVPSPADLFGSYSVAASAGVTLIKRGYNIQSAISLKSKRGLGFEVGFQGEKAYGLGVRVHGMIFKIKPVSDSMMAASSQGGEEELDADDIADLMEMSETL